MPRHVVLLTRDASLVVAVKALLGDEDRVSELGSPQELPPVGELPVDAVVIDLPKPSRAISVERVRGRFSGPLVVLLGHGEDPAKARVTHRCSVLTRPFGMAQLWSMLVGSAAEAATEVIPRIQRAGAPPDPRRDRAGSPLPTPASERPAPAPASRADRPARASERQPQVPEGPVPAPRPKPSEPVPRRPAPEPQRRVPAWSWRRRRFQYTPAEAPGAGELTQPMPAVPPAGNGGTPAAEHPATAPEVVATHAAQAQVWPQVEAPGEDAGARANGETPRPSAETAATRDQAAPDPPETAATPDQVPPDPPEAVAGRLAERLGADIVALLLDNNHGLLEVAGGVGLTAAERQLQVEYGHEVLLELFRVGVGLIEDTDRVRGLIRGIPGSRSQSLVMVPLVHEGHGFGALIVGRTSLQGQLPPEFTEPEIEALMDFAEDVAAPLRSTVLLRRLKGQLKTPDRT